MPEEFNEGELLFNKETNLRKNTWKKIQKSLYNDIEFENSDIIQILKHASKNLKKVDLIKTKINIENKKNNMDVEPIFLGKNEYISGFYFFETMLGYIDKKIEEQNKTKEIYLFLSRLYKHTENEYYEDRIKLINKLHKFRVISNIDFKFIFFYSIYN